jgi:hypothetical protein
MSSLTHGLFDTVTQAHSECSQGLPSVDPVRFGYTGNGKDTNVNGSQKETS